MSEKMIPIDGESQKKRVVGFPHIHVAILTDRSLLPLVLLFRF
jgi:hypothetical protein